MARKLYVVRFTVRGASEFPFDMLRYDSCHPRHEPDARAMGRLYARNDPQATEPREVVLESRGRDRHWEPTAARWQSFLWNVVPDSIETHEHA